MVEVVAVAHCRMQDGEHWSRRDQRGKEEGKGESGGGEERT